MRTRIFLFLAAACLAGAASVPGADPAPGDPGAEGKAALSRSLAALEDSLVRSFEVLAGPGTGRAEMKFSSGALGTSGALAPPPALRVSLAWARRDPEHARFSLSAEGFEIDFFVEPGRSVFYVRALNLWTDGCPACAAAAAALARDPAGAFGDLLGETRKRLEGLSAAVEGAATVDGQPSQVVSVEDPAWGSLLVTARNSDGLPLRFEVKEPPASAFSIQCGYRGTALARLEGRTAAGVDPDLRLTGEFADGADGKSAKGRVRFSLAPAAAGSAPTTVELAYEASRARIPSEREVAFTPPPGARRIDSGAMDRISNKRLEDCPVYRALAKSFPVIPQIRSAAQEMSSGQDASHAGGSGTAAKTAGSPPAPGAIPSPPGSQPPRTGGDASRKIDVNAIRNEIQRAAPDLLKKVPKEVRDAIQNRP